MARMLLSDDQWELIEDLFPPPARTGRPRCDRRTVMNGIFWILRTGSPWRDLPEEFGKWKSAWRLFDQWNHDGLFAEILCRLQGSFVKAEQLDNALWCIDGTIVRAARCCTGGGKKGIQTNRMITH